MESAESTMKGKYRRVTETHSFDWSLQLWADASGRIRRTSLGLLVLYLALAFVGCHTDGYRGIGVWYLIASTVTTVRGFPKRGCPVLI